MDNNEDFLISEKDDELLIIAMQHLVYDLKDKWEKVRQEMLEQEDKYNTSSRLEKYCFEKLLSVAKFLNKYNGDAYEDWIDELGLKELL